MVLSGCNSFSFPPLALRSSELNLFLSAENANAERLGEKQNKTKYNKTFF